MKNYVLGKMLMAQMKMKDFVKNLAKNEEGDTNFVSIILIIVIVVGIATLFRKELMGLAEDVIDQLTEFVNG